MVLSIFMTWISRKKEYQADYFGVSLTRDKTSAIAALKKIAADNLSNLTPHPFHVMLNYSHPPDLERIRAIDKIQLPESADPLGVIE